MTRSNVSSRGGEHRAGQSRRIAYCECGAQLAGRDETELFEATQRHLAHLHPELLGAMDPETVQQMSEEVPASPESRARPEAGERVSALPSRGGG